MKYILLYNYWGDEDERDLLRVLQELMPDIEVRPFQIIGREIVSGKSIWVPEEKYLMAWTIWHYYGLTEYIHTDDDYRYETIEDGLKWFESHRNDELFVWHKDGKDEKQIILEKLYKQYTDAMKLLEMVQDKMSFDEFSKYVDILENNGIEI
jgi:hypothetical protein